MEKGHGASGGDAGDTAVPRPSEDDRGTEPAGQRPPRRPDLVGRVELEPTTTGLKVLVRACRAVVGDGPPSETRRSSDSGLPPCPHRTPRCRRIRSRIAHAKQRQSDNQASGTEANVGAPTWRAADIGTPLPAHPRSEGLDQAGVELIVRHRPGVLAGFVKGDI